MKRLQYLALFAALFAGLSFTSPVSAQTATTKTKQAAPLYNGSSSGKNAPLFMGQGDQGKASAPATGLTSILKPRPYTMKTQTVAIEKHNNLEAARRYQAQEDALAMANREIRAKRQAEIRSKYAAVQAQNAIKAAQKAPMRADEIRAAGMPGQSKDEAPAEMSAEEAMAASVAAPAADHYAGKTVVLKSRGEGAKEKKPNRLFNMSGQ